MLLQRSEIDTVHSYRSLSNAGGNLSIISTWYFSTLCLDHKFAWKSDRHFSILCHVPPTQHNVPSCVFVKSWFVWGWFVLEFELELVWEFEVEFESEGWWRSFLFPLFCTCAINIIYEKVDYCFILGLNVWVRVGEKHSLFRQELVQDTQQELAWYLSVILGELSELGGQREGEEWKKKRNLEAGEAGKGGGGVREGVHGRWGGKRGERTEGGRKWLQGVGLRKKSWTSSAAIPRWTFRVSSDPRRQASQGPESIDVGDQSRTLCCRRYIYPFASEHIF